MSVVRRESLRRWSVVSAGVAVLCLLPAVVAAWPVATVADVDPAELRERILASADQPYQGDVTTDGRLGLPRLPELEEVGGALGGSARIRAWYAGPVAWRVAELSLTGERDTYRTAYGEYRWDFERDLATLMSGQPSVWLPGAPDVVPPTLARRLLAAEGRLERLPGRRVAGVGAAGVRMSVADPDTTVGRVDVWADPATGLPVQVEVAGRGGGDPVFTTRFLQLRQAAPGEEVLAPRISDRAGFTVTTAIEVDAALAEALPGVLPETLAGRARASWAAAADVTGGAVYGTGFASVVVLALPGGLGGRMIDAGRDAGTPAPVPEAEAYEMRASLLTALVVHAENAEPNTLHAWLLVGLVDPLVLQRGATELVGTV
jgi:hypothetical protein